MDKTKFNRITQASAPAKRAYIGRSRLLFTLGWKPERADKVVVKGGHFQFEVRLITGMMAD